MKTEKLKAVIMSVLFLGTVLFVGCESMEISDFTLEQLRTECTDANELILRAKESNNICVIESEKLVNGKNRLNDFFINVKKGIKDYIEFVDVERGEVVCDRGTIQITEKYYPKNSGEFKSYNHSAEIINKGNMSDEEVREKLLKKINVTSSFLGDISVNEPHILVYVCRLDFDGEKFTFSNNVIKYDLQNDVYIGTADDPVDVFVFEETKTNLYIETYSTEVDEENADFSRYICWMFKNGNKEVVKAIDWFE